MKYIIYFLPAVFFGISGIVINHFQLFDLGPGYRTPYILMVALSVAGVYKAIKLKNNAKTY
ncbi:hypothetical protein [uncultured Chryseobacterium sp.]|uniref:hypothetical protein n=1 Tax=uncultured Chryseobacterium sp. TaxID=259322 RepID=UPI0025CF64FA|nr:hypothetical protein [uncultured Chryseobacterium sp.]